MLERLFFIDAALILNQYLGGVLEPIPNVFCWRHRGFDNPSVHPYLPDGGHVNSFGQYCLYRSYRGAILKALRFVFLEGLGHDFLGCFV